MIFCLYPPKVVAYHRTNFHILPSLYRPVWNAIPTAGSESVRMMQNVADSCLYGTDFMAAPDGTGSSAARMLWGIAGGVVVGAVIAGAAGLLGIPLARGSGNTYSWGLGGTCRVQY